MTNYGAGNETRTRDLNLGKVALYQLSYSRPKQRRNCRALTLGVKENCAQYDAKALNSTAIFQIHGYEKAAPVDLAEEGIRPGRSARRLES
jgi:hypothetical protein